MVELEDGSHIALEAGANGTLTAKIPMTKSGLYHFAAIDQGQSWCVRLSPLDYFIEAQDDQAPTVPYHPSGRGRQGAAHRGSDHQRNGSGRFRRCRVAGSALLGERRARKRRCRCWGPRVRLKTAEGKVVLALEDFKLQPGDVVSLYATAKDARNTAQTDIFFIEAQAYERNYTQSQQGDGGGGGGGGGGDGQQQQQIWDRQKQVITATYNATRPNDKTKTKETLRGISRPPRLR